MPHPWHDFEGKRALVLGVANQRSIAWAIARALAEAGAGVTLTYQGERVRERVEALARELPRARALACDATSDSDIANLVRELAEEGPPRLDAMVHSIAFAPREELEGRFAETSRAGFLLAHEVSVYSLTALARRVQPLMTEGGAVVTLSYYGAEKVIPNYNVMGVAKAALEASVRYLANDLGPVGIRVNAISAGPVNTLAARAISGFTRMLRECAERAPLRRNVTVEEVAAAALFLLSPLASGITGEVLHVDAGYNIMGM